jgi:hypothetical protein
MDRDTIGMTPTELEAYLEALLREEAAEAAADSGLSVDEELATPGFASVRAAASYTIHMIDANNAYIARFLLDRGVLEPGGDVADETATDGDADGAPD